MIQNKFFSFKTTLGLFNFKTQMSPFSCPGLLVTPLPGGGAELGYVAHSDPKGQVTMAHFMVPSPPGFNLYQLISSFSCSNPFHPLRSYRPFPPAANLGDQQDVDHPGSQDGQAPPQGLPQL